MTAVGFTLAAGDTARWLEAGASTVECVEVAADGFFARPSPYLAWLGERFPLIVRSWPMLTASPGPTPPAQLEALARVCGSAQARFVVHPVGYDTTGDTHLRRTVPLPPTSTMLETAAAHLTHARATCRGTTLIEPVATVLRVEGSLSEEAFLSELCDAADCRLLVDLTTLLVASRNHRFDAAGWLRAIRGDRIGAARIGGASFLRGRWRHDPAGTIDEDAWNLLELLLSHADPEVLLLDHREQPDGVEGLQHELSRLRSAGGSSSAWRAGESRDAGSDAPSLAADVALFVLDREGVFLSGARHELTLFNTAATYVWCLLEEGSEPSEIAKAYAGTFAVAPDEAERHVGTVLRQWFGRGYLTRPGSLPAAPTSFGDALAWLLTNPLLRARFRRDPAALADLLGVGGEDRDLLVALDPCGLDAQAEDETADVPANDTRDPGSPQESGPAIAVPDEAARYRLLTTTFAVISERPETGREIHQALGHLSIPASAPEVVIHVRDGRKIFENGVLAAEVRGAGAIVPAVKVLLRERAVERSPFFMSVHAGVVAFGDDCVLLPATAGSGKTTLTAALARSGATYFSDEIALLGDTLAVTAVPLALTVKDGSLEPLRRLYPEIDALTRHAREDYVGVRYLPPPAVSLPGPGASARARWIVFPQYSPGARTELRPIDRPSALRRLLEESYVPPRSLTRTKVESLVQWMRTVDCYELPFSSLQKAVDLVRGLAHSDAMEPPQPEVPDIEPAIFATYLRSHAEELKAALAEADPARPDGIDALAQRVLTQHLQRLRAGPARPVAFLDRDGVINERAAPHQYVTSWDQFRWVDGILPLLRGLADLRFPLLVVTNQQGIGKGIMSEAALEAIHAEMTRTLEREGISLTRVLHCPHLEQDRCPCRKPRPGLIYRAMHEMPFLIDVARSLLIGDADSDMRAAMAAGVGTRILVGGDERGEAATHHVARVQDVLQVVTDAFPFNTSSSRNWRRPSRGPLETPGAPPPGTSSP